MSPNDAVNALVSAGFKQGNVSYAWVLAPNPGDPLCEVISSNPAPGAGTSKNAKVTLTFYTDEEGEAPPGCLPGPPGP